jgi:oligo-alginate lyase
MDAPRLHLVGCYNQVSMYRIWALLALSGATLAAAPHPRLLFDSNGIDQLKERVRQPEYSAQWTAFQKSYDAGMGAAIELPPRGSNWYHWYVCPKHGVRLTTGKRLGPWQWEHICPADREVFRGDPSKPQTDFDGCALSGVHDRYSRAVRDGGVLYQVTGDKRYADRVRAILLAYAARYLDYPLHTTTGEAKIGGGRIGPQTLDESTWLIPVAQGADLVWDTLSDADRATIAEKLFLPAARDVILPHRMGVHNIQCWKNSAVGLTGFLLGDDALIRAAIDDPDRGYRAQMAKGVQGDGVWFEGAWGYHFYTLSALWPLTEAARSAGIDLYGEPLKKMFAAPIQLAMPNLMLPAFNDSGETAVRNPIYELAYARYHDPLFLAAVPGGNNEFALWFGAAPRDAKPPAPVSRNFPDSGYAILSQGGTWLCLKYGPHGGGHGHPDKNNFILYARGQVLFPDPGTRPYGSPLHTDWDRATVGHNTLVVDGKSQSPATGKLLAFGDRYAMTDAGAIYPGMQFIRTVVMVSENVILFVDRVTADAPHTFDLTNHLAGTWKNVEGEPVSLPYRYVEDARKVRSVATHAAALTLAETEPTEIVAATGPGKSTAERIPMALFRRKGRETIYVWAISLDGVPVKLAVEGNAVRVGASTVAVDTAAHTVRIER